MSWRHATSAPLSAATAIADLQRNFGHSYRMQTLEKPTRPLQVEPRVGRFDAEEEAVRGRARELGYVEHRVIGLRQPVQRPHPDKGRQRGAQDGGLERYRNELRPAVPRPPADVKRIRHRLRPVLQAVAA